MRSFMVCGFVFLFLLSGFVYSAELKVATVERNLDVESFVGYAPNKIVVKLEQDLLSAINKQLFEKGRLGIPALDRLSEKYDVDFIQQQFPGASRKIYQGREINLTGWHKFHFSNAVDAKKVVEEFKQVSGVIDAQPIGIHTVYKIPNDGNLSDQWHLNQSNDADMDAPEAWDIETGDESIIGAILDTGVRYYHRDLGGSNGSSSNPENIDGNMWINWAEKNGTEGVDDDGNGYVDDWVGWDFVTGISNAFPGEDGDTPDNDPRDFNGHGTHCSGILAAMNNNDYAVASVSGGWGDGTRQPDGNGVKIMALRIGWSERLFIFEVGYVSMDFAAEAFYYAADMGARTANCSWGSSNSGGLADAVDYFLASGGLVFHAAGNDGADSPSYLDNRGDVISVASTDENDAKSDFSNYGSWVDISAPGSNIWSTYHDHDDPDNDYVASLSGTSMASPNAMSVASLIWSQNPSLTAAEVEQRLYDTADDLDAGNPSYAGLLGAGRVNAYNAVNTGGPAAPSAAFSGTPTSGCHPLTVNFTDESTGEIDSWSWDFGDGGTSTAQNPSHEYTAAGNYTVSLTVTGPGGSDTETKTDYISVSEAPVADFSGTPTSGEAPLTVDFTDQSTGNPSEWSWDFGDGGTSTAQNPSHEYTSAGTYTVSLTSTNSCGSDAETKVDYITVTEPTCDVPVADFSGSPLSGDAPLTVNFTDQSTNSPTSWSWDFGDGGTSTAQNPSHEYTAAGTYTVSMTATNSCGSDTETKVDYITVSEPSQENVMHVQSVDVVKQTYSFWSRGQATVRIVDASGNPVADASVSGQWSGGASDTDDFTTDSDGYGTAYSDIVRGAPEYTFCVTGVSKSGWTYDEAANVETCGSSDGSSSQVLSANEFGIKELQKVMGDEIHYNSPNPFNPTTTIHFFLTEPSQVKVEIYNALGEKINTLLNGSVGAGDQSVVWNARDQYGKDVGSGFYFYRITIDNRNTFVRKMMLLK